MTPCMNKAWMYIMKPFGTDGMGLAFSSLTRSKNAGQEGLRAGNRSGVKIGDLMLELICPAAAISTMNVVDFCGSNLQHRC